MPSITLEHAEAKLAQWLAASTAVATGQEYEIETRLHAVPKWNRSERSIA
jgi:hypothetical protein